MGFHKNSTCRKRKLTENKKQKNSASKYDFVKVRVHLSEQHYYVLSRFLLCRMLMAARIKYGHALRIALDLKKRLVDKAQLNVTQKALQSELFDLFQQHGYGSEHVQWYRTMASFHHQRIPLVILLAGTSSTGKSSIATYLSERLNLSSVLKTDVVYDLMHTIMDGTTPSSLWTQDTEDAMDLLENECTLICRGLNSDVCKSVTDGKSIIIEGDLVNHKLLDQMHQFVDQSQTVIIAPFLLTISESSLHRQLVDETCTLPNECVDNAFKRIEEWQASLLKTNKERQANLTDHLPSFNVIQVNMEHLQRSIDVIQGIVLERIAATMKNLPSKSTE
ncbi:hypothetical protein J3Q64DRAFT_1703293 [Phycomyces blakesleeanus]|uniref:2-phosphoglycerate kinase n=2 Tax=Phycomyces blakesleeanus TaxID=4837 RepID=A0A167L866_PHYB8|nr:hypothetical protein PHYBLDRAFT_148988 [Phycomyces blakesleeanus NRRL 1555(-)]OAD69805.1 hypothetical protein PHYBLDRAFT_148988 [Phycomyces blakesleeanus NRRL 1555(-)]|eukprot:XP_018287845.1 hypothetical protein PHYBLDRAFT_148988 [Phycomyces blakesleeanus NRRL 1555(-)]